MAQPTTPDELIEYESWVGKCVHKSNSRKPFKSKLAVNTVKGLVNHPFLAGVKAFVFVEDDSYVRCSICALVPNQGTIVP
jgi:hypothetical protein